MFFPFYESISFLFLILSHIWSQGTRIKHIKALWQDWMCFEYRYDYVFHPLMHYISNKYIFLCIDLKPKGVYYYVNSNSVYMTPTLWKPSKLLTQFFKKGWNKIKIATIWLFSMLTPKRRSNLTTGLVSYLSLNSTLYRRIELKSISEPKSKSMTE